MSWTTGRSRFVPRRRRKDFSCSLCVQTVSGAHPASCTMSTGGSFPRGVTLNTHPHPVPRSRMSRGIPPIPLSASLARSGTALFFYIVTVLDCSTRILFTMGLFYKYSALQPSSITGSPNTPKQCPSEQPLYSSFTSPGVSQETPPTGLSQAGLNTQLKTALSSSLSR
jgi:hypothetical protein